MLAAGMSYLAWQKSAANRTAESAAARAHSEADRARAEAQRAHVEAVRARDAIRMAVAFQAAMTIIVMSSSCSAEALH